MKEGAIVISFFIRKWFCSAILFPVIVENWSGIVMINMKLGHTVEYLEVLDIFSKDSFTSSLYRGFNLCDDRGDPHRLEKSISLISAFEWSCIQGDSLCLSWLSTISVKRSEIFMTMCSSYEMLGWRKSLITLFQSSAVKMLTCLFFALSILPKSVSLVRNYCPLSKKVSGLIHVHEKGNLRLIPILAGATVSETVNLKVFGEINWLKECIQTRTKPYWFLFSPLSLTKYTYAPLLLWRLFLSKLYSHICRL